MHILPVLNQENLINREISHPLFLVFSDKVIHTAVHVYTFLNKVKID